MSNGLYQVCPKSVPRIALTAVKGRKLTKKSIGYWRAPDGVRRPKRWYFPSNTDTARRLVATIKAEWILIRATTPASRQATWTPQALARIELFRNGFNEYSDAPHPQTVGAVQPQSAQPPHTSATPPSNDPLQNETNGGLHLYNAIAEYDTHLAARAAAKQITLGRLVSLRRAFQYLKKLMPDVPLDTIRHDQLTRLVATVAARPETMTRSGKGKGIAISIHTVASLLTSWKTFFQWLADSERWAPPKGNLPKLFKINRAKLLTPAELQQSSRGVKTFTIDELRSMYRRAAVDERARLFILLALNCGFTQMEIATLKRWEIHLDAQPAYIERARNKTNVLGRWVLWSETAELLRRQMATADAKNNPDDLALVADDGLSLMRWDEKLTKFDAVGKLWFRLLDQPKTVRRHHAMRALTQQHPHATRREILRMYKQHQKTWDDFVDKQYPNLDDVRRLGFKYLRKTAHDLARKIGGVEVAETLTQHADKAMARAYSNRDFEKVADCLRTMRQQLQPMFAPDAATASM